LFGLRKRVIVIVLVCLVPIPASAGNPKDPEPKVRITCIASEGFLIETDHDKILIEALYGEEACSFCDNPSDEALQDMIHARGEYSNIDLVAVTHMHRDHFFAPFVSDHLSYNLAGKFISCGQSVELLSQEEVFEKFSDRVIEFTPGSPMYADT